MYLKASVFVVKDSPTEWSILTSSYGKNVHSFITHEQFFFLIFFHFKIDHSHKNVTSFITYGITNTSKHLESEGGNIFFLQKSVHTFEICKCNQVEIVTRVIPIRKSVGRDNVVKHWLHLEAFVLYYVFRVRAGIYYEIYRVIFLTNVRRMTLTETKVDRELETFKYEWYHYKMILLCCDRTVTWS